MSLFTTSLAFTVNPQIQGLFSSQSAFKKPSLKNSFNNVPNRLPTSLHPKDFSSKQSQPVKIIAKSQDPDLIMCEPVKKLKLSKEANDELVCFGGADHKKSQQNLIKPSKLTIESVFDTPAVVEPADKGLLTEDCFEDEASSLSFISSCSSLDNGDDDVIIVAERKESEDCMILGSVAPSYQANMENLVVKDDIIGRLGYLNHENMFVNNLEFDLESIKQLVCNVPLSIPPNDLNKYIEFSNSISNQSPYNMRFLSDKTVNEFTKANGDGYDSDSYATRSTSVEQEASQKGASPVYGASNALYNEESEQDLKVKKQKSEKIKKQQAKKNTNEKKKKLLNLKLDVNPKQLKVERRLNRLQLLRYQQGTNEEELGIPELLSRTTSAIQEDNDIVQPVSKINDTEAQLFFNEFLAQDETETVLPALGEANPRRKRGSLVPAWNPDSVKEEELEGYLKELEQIFEYPITNIEAAIKLLKAFNYNIIDTLNTMRENRVFYSEVFRVKVKRLRRGGI